MQVIDCMDGTSKVRGGSGRYSTHTHTTYVSLMLFVKPYHELQPIGGTINPLSSAFDVLAASMVPHIAAMTLRTVNILVRWSGVVLSGTQGMVNLWRILLPKTFA